MLDARTHALSRCRLFTSSGVEETEARIGEVMQPHKLRPIGPVPRHTGRMDFLRLPSVGIGAISFGRMSLKLDQVQDYHLMMFCSAGQARIKSFRREMTVTRRLGICLAPGDPLDGEFSEDAEQIVLRIDADAMRRHTGMRRPRMEREIDISRPRIGPWLSFMRMVLTDADTIDLISSNARMRVEYENLFFSLIMAAGLVQDEAVSRTVAPAAVKRAEEFIDAHYGDPIRLQDIADAACVPVRTLLDSFSRFRETSPMRHLRNRRLEAARRTLLEGAESTTIMSVALDAGINHAGRFSAEYAERFGEKPSDTLRRQKRTLAASSR